MAVASQPATAGKESFAALLDQSLGTASGLEGTVIKGRVVAIENEMVLIDVGLKSEGRVALKEFTGPGRGGEIKPGDTVEVYLERMEDKNGEAQLSREKARRETTILPRERSILRIWKGCGVPMSGVMSRTGRISTWLPGRNATAPERSTVKPPLTRLKITPVTRSFAWKFFSSCVQASSRRAFSRESCASPFLSSIRSR